MSSIKPSEPVIDRLSPSQRPPGLAVMHQKWRSLLFLHWSFPPETVRKFIPKGLELDTFDGLAYVGLVPFLMTGVRPAFLPAVRGLSEFPETNVRTYVHRRGRDPGVWFFSLDAANPIAVILARALFHLSYHRARMTLVKDPNTGRIHYDSTRFWPPPVPASTMISCKPIGKTSIATPGTLDHFLIERYLLYTTHGDVVYRGQVHHAPYLVQTAEIDAFHETILASHGLLRPNVHPLIHFAEAVDVEIFPIKSEAD